MYFYFWSLFLLFFFYVLYLMRLKNDLGCRGFFGFVFCYILMIGVMNCWKKLGMCSSEGNWILRKLMSKFLIWLLFKFWLVMIIKWLYWRFLVLVYICLCFRFRNFLMFLIFLFFMICLVDVLCMFSIFLWRGNMLMWFGFRIVWLVMVNVLVELFFVKIRVYLWLCLVFVKLVLISFLLFIWVCLLLFDFVSILFVFFLVNFMMLVMILDFWIFLRKVLFRIYLLLKVLILVVSCFLVWEVKVGLLIK